MLDRLCYGPVRGSACRSVALAGIGLMVAVSVSLAEQAGTVTFSKDVAPLIFENCAGCHRPDSTAPFSLLTYDEVRPWARAIKQVTQARSMPPWKPEPGFGGPFVGERRLSDAQVALLGAWVDAGAPEGDVSDLPPFPEWPEGWRLGEPDLVIEMPDPYTLPAGVDDVFRKFAIPIPVEDLRYVRGLEFHPGNPRVVHHANLRIDPTPSSRELDEQDPEPGYEGVTPFAARFPPGYFLGWTPGQVRPLAPQGMAWSLHPGSDLLLELHLMASDQPEAVQSRIGLFFSDEPPTKAPFMIRLGKQNLDIPPGVQSYLSQDRYVLPVDVEVSGVQPHAHYLAKDVKGFATLPDGTRKWLIHIEDWDFNWQEYYHYAAPFVLPKGTELTMEFTYDNSAGNRRNPSSPPRRVTWGQHSSNEMGDLWIQVLPRSETDLEILKRDREPRELAEDLVGYEKILEFEPDLPMAHDDAALLYLHFGKVPEAAAHFRESVRLAPTSPAAHYNLGTTQLMLGDLDEAIASFQVALELDPRYVQAHNNLGAVRRSQGNLEEAIRHFREGIRINPEDGDALYNLANALTQQGAVDEALVFYRRAVDAQPDAPEPAVELAWILATDPNPPGESLRQAVGLAERATQLTDRGDANILDTLAAAYAAAGRFDEAIATAREALALVPAGETQLATSIEDRVALYTERRPYRRPR